MSQANFAILTLTVAAAGAVASNRFVTQAGAYPAAGALAFGVSRSSAAAQGDLIPTDVQGTAIVEYGGDVSVDDALMADATGRAVRATVGAKYPLARAMEAGAAGTFGEVLLVPNAGLVTAAS